MAKTNTTDNAAKGTRLSKWLPVIICGIVMVLGIGASVMISTDRSSQLGEQYQTINGLENRKATLEAAISDDTKDAIHLASGLDSARQAKDDGVAKKLLEQVFTWDSKESYDAARAKVKEQYNLGDDSTFLKTFMPEVKNINTGDHDVNEIDARGLNMTYSNMQSNVTNINGDRYTYFTLVTVESSDSTGATAEGTSAFVYTVDGSGNLSDLAGYSIQ